MDLGFSSRWFTWERGCALANNIRERLDKGVANQACWDMFPKYSLKHLSHAISNHCPLFVNLGIREESSRNHNRFKFNASWVFEEACEKQVRSY